MTGLSDHHGRNTQLLRKTWEMLGMNALRAKFSVILLAAMSGTGCSDGPTRLGNASAMAVINEGWKDDGKISFLLGPVRFRRDSWQYADGTALLTHYPCYQAAAQAGLLTLSDERDLTRNFGNWNDFWALTQNGINRLATTTLTDDGKSKATIIKAGGREFAAIQFGTYTVERIVSNEPLDSKTDRYRVVLGTHVFDLRPEMKQLWIDCGHQAHTDRRFRVLVKYDPFDSRWKYQVSDVEARERDFSTNNVPNAIAALR